MTNNRFISALRDYAALARARRVSYAAAVKRLVDLREESALLGVEEPSDREKVMREIRGAAVREYGKFDAEFSIPDGN
jgi:hypothetical protein